MIYITLKKEKKKEGNKFILYTFALPQYKTPIFPLRYPLVTGYTSTDCKVLSNGESY